MPQPSKLANRWALPVCIFGVCAAVYVLTLGPSRRTTRSDNAHYVYLAESLLHGQLHLVAERPPGRNDWALYPPRRQATPERPSRWYVSFPPFPALLILPAVAVWGTDMWDRLFWALLAGLGPALVFVLLRHLSECGRSARNMRDNLVLTALFAFGTVYYYTAVQGTVWYAAHVVLCSLLALFVLFSIDARRPALAGAMLGLAFLTRPTVLLAGVFFGVEALARARRQDAPPPPADLLWYARAFRWLSAVRVRSLLPTAVVFALPLAAALGIALAMNAARFDDPFAFGHEYLQIKWRGRIETWGLFNYHYLAKNLAVFLAALPWLSDAAPFIKVSRHGLALWFTTPNLLLVLWPRRVGAGSVGLYAAAVLIALVDLCYQNSGWIQFGYRFALDYMVLLFALLALGGRRFGPGFYACAILAFAINLFGAITFDRMPAFYDKDPTQKVIFQPD